MCHTFLFCNLLNWFRFVPKIQNFLMFYQCWPLLCVIFLKTKYGLSPKGRCENHFFQTARLKNDLAIKVASLLGLIRETANCSPLSEQKSVKIPLPLMNSNSPSDWKIESKMNLRFFEYKWMLPLLLEALAVLDQRAIIPVHCPTWTWEGTWQ